MNCEHTQLVLSARMDGERVRRGGLRPPRPTSRAVPDARPSPGGRRGSAAPCGSAPPSRCPTWSSRSWSPSRGSGAPCRRPPADRGADRLPATAPPPPADLAPTARRRVAGIVVGSVLVGGPWQRPANRPIAAAAVVRNVRGAAPTLNAFQAPTRSTSSGSPARFPDGSWRWMSRSSRPSGSGWRSKTAPATRPRSWTPTDLLYIEDLTRAFTSGPSGCPGDLPVDVCPRTRTTVTRLSEYSAAAPLPADLVLPLATFGSARGFQVIGSAIGSTAVTRSASVCPSSERRRCSLSCGSAAPGGPSSSGIGCCSGSTRSPGFPLRIVVYPSRDRERREWELRYGRDRRVTRRADPRRPDGDRVRRTAGRVAFRIPGAPPPIQPRLDDVRRSDRIRPRDAR